jgi:hypothetical protein
LTHAIRAVSDRFDRECRRTFARTVNATFEFDPHDTELLPPCYPIESVTRFETKSSEATGWQELIPAPDYLIRRSCIISLSSPLRTPHSALRILYTGGYVLPGDTPSPSNAPLPADLEQAALEQVVFWFANRDRVGVIREWPKGGLYQQFADLDLIPSVRATLAKYARILW